MTPVMTFQLASGLRVWCGRGVRSGKKRSLLLGSTDDERTLELTDELRLPTADCELARRPIFDGGDGAGRAPGVSTDEGDDSSPSGSSTSEPALAAVRNSNNGKPDVAPALGCQRRLLCSVFSTAPL